MRTGQVAGVDPEAFKIVDGKLFLGWSKTSMNKWAMKRAPEKKEDIRKADQMWSKINAGN